MGILARLILKFGMPFLSTLIDEIFFGVFFGFLICFLMLFTKDFKVFIAFSSILHITVFCLRLYIFNVFVFEYFLIPHTLLSRSIFFYFSFLVRIYPFFGSFLSRFLLVFWLRVPFAINFLVEFFMFNYMFFDILILLFWFRLFCSC